MSQPEGHERDDEVLEHRILQNPPPIDRLVDSARRLLGEALDSAIAKEKTMHPGTEPTLLTMQHHLVSYVLGPSIAETFGSLSPRQRYDIDLLLGESLLSAERFFLASDEDAVPELSRLRWDLTRIGRIINPDESPPPTPAEAQDRAARAIRGLKADFRVLSRQVEGVREEQIGQAVRFEAEQTQRVDRFLSDRAQAAAAAESERNERAQRQVEERVTALDDAIGRMLDTQSRREQERDSQFEGRWERMAEKIRQDVSDVQHEAKVRIDSAAEQADTATAVIGARLREAERLVGVLGDRGVTTGFKREADAARFAKHLWQALAVVAMVGLIVIAVFAFLPIVGGVFSWPAFAGKAFVTAAVGVLAAYAAHQGDAHARAEAAHRRRELELAAVGPFLATLSEEQQAAFKLALAERVFGRPGDDASDAKASPATLLDVVQGLARDQKSIREVLDTLVKAKSLGA